MTAPQQGARAWLAISGGIDVPIVLGSRSTDVRSGFGGLGGRALQAGDLLPLARPSEIGARIAEKLRLASLASWSAPNEWSHTTRTHEFLRFVRGADWLDLSEKARASFVHETFTVAADSDRMGVRLKGLPLPQSRMADTLSGAVAPGTVQLPPGGQPILLLGDCQTIGGYRKIAHVITIDLPAAAQLAAGDAIRFVEVTLAEAQRWLIEREQEVARFRIGLELQTP